VNLGCRSETFCTQPAGNAGPKKFTIWAPSHNFVGLYVRNSGTYRQLEKNLLNGNVSPTCPHKMVNFGPLALEICWRVWGTPAHFNGFRVLAVLLHGTVVVGVSQTLRRWTEGATYIQQGGHHVGHWPTFLVLCTLQGCGGEVAFSALTLLVWDQEGHPACKKLSGDWWGPGMVTCLEPGANDLHMVQLMPLPPHHLSLQ